MLAATSTRDSLNTLCSSVVEWHARLDDLSGQIARRQVELALLGDDRQPTRSLKKQGSTESLRPRDREESADENPLSVADHDLPQILPSSSLQYKNTRPRPSSATGSKNGMQPFDSTPKKSPGISTRPSFTASSPMGPPDGPAKLRKRKPESLRSGESAFPKYRTRSMIIVYYDSAVQEAFAELVKFVSGSRNTIRKGRMAARMAEMRRAAELDIQDNDESDNDEDRLLQLTNIRKANRPVSPSPKGNTVGEVGINSASAEVELEGAPKPGLASPRSALSGDTKLGGVRSPLGLGRSRNAELDIFDEIDKALEWCQGHCEHAAHRFLREGDCSTEIDNIKKRLSQIKACAGNEVKRLDEEEVNLPPTVQAPQHQREGKARELKSPQIRKAPGQTKQFRPDLLEVDDMEVDDEGFDEEPPKLVFKRSRDIGR